MVEGIVVFLLEFKRPTPQMKRMLYIFRCGLMPASFESIGLKLCQEFLLQRKGGGGCYLLPSVFLEAEKKMFCFLPSFLVFRFYFALILIFVIPEEERRNILARSPISKSLSTSLKQKLQLNNTLFVEWHCLTLNVHVIFLFAIILVVLEKVSFKFCCSY